MSETTKAMRFDMVTANADVFVLNGMVALAEATRYRKVSSRKAIVDGDANADPFAMKPSDIVHVIIPPTPAEEIFAAQVSRQDRRPAHVGELLLSWVAKGERYVNDLRETLLSDPAYALGAADRGFAVVARLAVARRVLSIMEARALVAGSDDALRLVGEIALEEALRGAADPSHSTSQSSNLMAEATTAAWAELAQTVTGRR